MENFQLVCKIIEDQGLKISSLILIQKPYTERRSYLTCKKFLPDVECIASSFPATFDSYPTGEISRDTVINLMIGDLQRTREYPKIGLQAAEDIPLEIWLAYEELIRRGFTKQLLSEDRLQEMGLRS